MKSFLGKFIAAFLLTATLFLNVQAQQTQPNPRTILRSGPMLGYSEMTETIVWLQTRQTATAQIRFWKHGKPETARLSEVVKTDEKSDLIARFTLSNLEFGTRFDYEVYLNGLLVPFDFPMQFQSQPNWRYQKDPEEPPAFKIAFGSCAYINDAPFDRPLEEKPYGSGFEVFRAIAAEKPDLMLWLGDNVYYREGDWLTEKGMRYRWAQNRELPELQQILANSHNYAIWDDHDFGPNDSDRTFRLRETSLKVFQDYWANNTYGTSEATGVFGRFEWGDVEFFLLDDRYHRSPNRLAETPDKVMFGEAQMKWLRESLANSRATFKIVAGGNQLLNPISAFESWGEFPAERQAFIKFVRDQKIEGLVFLSGDRHLTELIRRTDLGTYPLYDFTSSPLTSGNSKPTKSEENNSARVAGTLVTEIKNFGIIEVSGAKDSRKLTLKAVDLNGKERWRHDISAAELKFQKK